MASCTRCECSSTDLDNDVSPMGILSFEHFLCMECAVAWTQFSTFQEIVKAYRFKEDLYTIARKRYINGKGSREEFSEAYKNMEEEGYRYINLFNNWTRAGV